MDAFCLLDNVVDLAADLLVSLRVLLEGFYHLPTRLELVLVSFRSIPTCELIIMSQFVFMTIIFLTVEQVPANHIISVIKF